MAWGHSLEWQRGCPYIDYGKRRKVKRANYIIIFIVILISLVVFSKIRYIFEGEEGRIKRLIYSAKSATEQENLIKCISFISSNYTDKYGNDRRSLLLLLKNAFDAYDDITIVIHKLSISLDTDMARAQVEATGVARNTTGDNIDFFETDTVKFLIVFQKEKARWQVTELELLEPRDVLLPSVS